MAVLTPNLQSNASMGCALPWMGPCSFDWLFHHVAFTASNPFRSYTVQQQRSGELTDGQTDTRVPSATAQCQ
jgi:hypothetical protein